MLETVAVESTFHALCAYTSLDCLFPLMHHFSSSWLKVIKDRLDVYLIWKISNSWRLKKKFKCEFQDCYAGSRIMNFDRPSSFVIFLYTVLIWLSMTIQTVWPSHSLSLSLVYLSLFLSPLLKGQTCQLWSRRCLRTRMMLVLLLKKKFINESRIYICVYGNRRPTWRPNLSTRQASPISRNSSVSIWTRFRNPNSSVTEYIYGGSIFRSTFILLNRNYVTGGMVGQGLGIDLSKIFVLLRII